MANDNNTAMQALRTQVARFVNLYNKLESIPFDVGNGDMLYASEMHTIEALGGGAGKTVTELCAAFGVTKGAVSQIVSKLSSKGYVEKNRSKSNRKEVELILTAKGRTVFEKHSSFHDAMDTELEEFLRAYPAEKTDEFRQIISVISAHIEKYINLKNKRI
jgi:DNA-binding MarR family transcriptional regulator